MNINPVWLQNLALRVFAYVGFLVSFGYLILGFFIASKQVVPGLIMIASATLGLTGVYIFVSMARIVFDLRDKAGPKT